MTAEDRLISESEFAVGVLGRGEEFALFPLDEPITAESQADARARGLVWCGVIAVKNGAPKVECAHPEAVYTMCFAGMSFARLVVERFKHLYPPKGDSTEWLQALHALQDHRA